MKRIALFFLVVFYFFACNNIVDPDVDPREIPSGDIKAISLKIHIPPNSLSTYAGEDASLAENGIDSIFISIFEGSTYPGTHLETRKFEGSDLVKLAGSIDSIINIAYEVDNISNPPLRVEVFANYRQPLVLPANTEIALPSTSSVPHNFFYMSGKADLPNNGTAYETEVHIVRNVAKLRVNVSLNSIVMPADLGITYNGIEIEVLRTRKTTTPFGGDPDDVLDYISYPKRSGLSQLRPASTPFTGGQIDSLYLFENLRTNSHNPASSSGSPAPSDGDYMSTEIAVTIPTTSNSEGNKSATYTYTLYTPTTDFAVLRNYIYTLDIKVRGQSLDPLITLDVAPWNDIPMKGDIPGTFLTLDKSDISFDENGEIEVNYCTDAQAIYFNFADFNQANTVNGAVLRGNIQTIGMDTSLVTFPLAPAGFQDAQITIDQFNTPYCGSFKFKLNPSDFPGFPNVDFSGQICIKAGNIIKCLTFPSRKSYDAHFIVGEPIFPGEQFVWAEVAPSARSWMEVSPSPLYTTAADYQYSGAASALYLHLDEFVAYYSTSPPSARTGTITLRTSGGATKQITISQLPAIRTGRFGYFNSSADDPVYTTELYTEQIHEFKTQRIAFKSAGGNGFMPGNALYNGRFTALNSSVVNFTQYSTSPNYFDYQATLYEAINYCAYKNRPVTKSGSGALSNSDIKWYLPSQSQLMAMWVTYESHKDLPTNDFFNDATGTRRYADLFWSSTDNSEYETQAQLVNFLYGNAGHYERTQPYWARCVRDGSTSGSSTTTSLVNLSNGFPMLLFATTNMPLNSYSANSKNGIVHHESDVANTTLYTRLRIANEDMDGGALKPWQFDVCNSYVEGGNTGIVWRLPTQRELQAIWILQDELKNECVSSSIDFDKLGDYYYWSGTNALESFYSPTSAYTHAWTTFGGKTPIGGAGNSPHQLKSTPYRVRCVNEF